MLKTANSSKHKATGGNWRGSHSLQGTFDTPEHIFKSPWALQMYTSAFLKMVQKQQLWTTVYL